MKTKPQKTTAKKAIIVRKEWPRIRDLTPTGTRPSESDAFSLYDGGGRL
jgi:hypothetical protein